jgi:putative transposase
MANTYTQIHIQAVFTVSKRECIISSRWENELYKYITGIIQNNRHKVLAINGITLITVTTIIGSLRDN